MYRAYRAQPFFVAKMSSYRILFAEDNKENQEITRHLLNKSGYAVDIADNGRKAVEAATAVRYDLILMDVQMPIMDGLTATEEIRKLENGRHVPIIAFTAFTGQDHVKQCLGCGMDDVLPKPVADHILLECLNRWICRKHVVLIADDMEDSRKLIEQYLSKSPYEAVFAQNGLEAISCFNKTDNISLVLLDMEMPVMDGYTAARALTALMGKNNVPIIAMTAHEGDAAITKCLKAGCIGYLSKPVTPEALLTTLEGQIMNKGFCIKQKRDRTITGEFIAYIDHEIKDLVPRFLENRRKDAAEISRLLAEGNVEAVRIIGHSMAGSAGGYGFPEIGAMGKAIEAAAREMQLQVIADISSRLSDYLARVTVIFKGETDKVNP